MNTWHTQSAQNDACTSTMNTGYMFIYSDLGCQAKAWLGSLGNVEDLRRSAPNGDAGHQMVMQATNWMACVPSQDTAPGLVSKSSPLPKAPATTKREKFANWPE